jgi:hypothetical protein
MFCSLLAMFGLGASLMRKVGNYFKIPQEARHAIMSFDLSKVCDLDGIADMEPVNSFLVRTEAGEVTVYNLVAVESTEQYLIDSDRTQYGSWLDFVDKNQPMTLD